MPDKLENKGPIKQLKLPFELNPSLLQTDLQRIKDDIWIAHYNKADYDGSWTSLALFSKDGSSSSIVASMNVNSALKATEIIGGVQVYTRSS